MANRRISELPLIGGTQIDEPDLLTLVHVFEVDPVLRNKKITFSGFKDYLNQYYVPKASGTFDGNITILGDLTVSGSTNVTTITGSNTATFSGLVVQAGTAAAPSVSVGTTDNGLYSPGVDQLALATSGTGSLFIDADGNIGIGSASTLAKFQVAGLSNYGMPAVEIEGVDAFYDITNNGSVSSLDATDASYGGIPLNTAIRNDTNTAGINFTNYGIQNHAIALDTGAGEFSIFSRDPSSRYSKVHITGSPERGLLFGIRGTDKFQFAHYSTSVDKAYESLFEISPTAVTSTFGGTERFRITSDGKLGVGTSTPDSELSIGNANANYRIDFGDEKAYVGYDTTYGSTGALYLDGGGSSNKDIILQPVSTGKVGIGTTSPASTLDVNGSFNLTGNAVFGDTSTDNVTTNGRLSVIAGSMASPGIRCSTDTDTGFQIGISANEIAAVTGGSEHARIDGSGRLLVGTNTNAGGALLQVNGDRVRIATAKTPTSASDTGTTGEICWDSSYIYVCTATDTWKRAALSTW